MNRKRIHILIAAIAVILLLGVILIFNAGNKQGSEAERLPQTEKEMKSEDGRTENDRANSTENDIYNADDPTKKNDDIGMGLGEDVEAGRVNIWIEPETGDMEERKDTSDRTAQDGSSSEKNSTGDGSEEEPRWIQGDY